MEQNINHQECPAPHRGDDVRSTGMKECSCCKKFKEINEFSLKRGKPNSRCRACIGEYMRKLYIANRERERAKRKLWYENNRESASTSVRQNYANNREAIKVRRRWIKYGITPEQQAKMLLEQQFRCAIPGCGGRNGNKALAVDHNHQTGLVRGMLCDSCNTALGLLKEDPKRIQGLLEYLAKYQK